jgi:hypothetical protein
MSWRDAPDEDAAAYDFGGDHFTACAPGLMHCRISIIRANDLFRLFLI